MVDDFDIGAHAPKLADEDVNLIHRLWLDVTKERGLEDLHHKEIVTTALANLEEQVNSKGRHAILDRMRALIGKRSRKEQEKGDNGHSWWAKVRDFRPPRTL